MKTFCFYEIGTKIRNTRNFTSSAYAGVRFDGPTSTYLVLLYSWICCILACARIQQANPNNTSNNQTAYLPYIDFTKSNTRILQAQSQPPNENIHHLTKRHYQNRLSSTPARYFAIIPPFSPTQFIIIFKPQLIRKLGKPFATEPLPLRLSRRSHPSRASFLHEVRKQPPKWRAAPANRHELLYPPDP